MELFLLTVIDRGDKDGCSTAHVNSDLDISGWDSWFDQMMINAAASIGGRDGTWLLQSVPFQGGAGKMLYSEFSNRQLLGTFLFCL